MAIGNRGSPKRSTCPIAPTTPWPNGFGRFRNPGTSRLPGDNVTPSIATTMASAASRATQRHRRDGSRPSGNSRMRNVPIRPIPGAQKLELNAST